MRIALLLVCILLISAGCSSTVPQPNQLPEASITSVSPAQPTEGEVVEFIGDGIDADGVVVGYRWNSNLDGELSLLPAFETASLSAGVHVIDFTVQDNNAAWSDRATVSVKVLPSATDPVRTRVFEASPSTIEVGENATLTWNISDATTVSINQDIGTVPLSGSLVVTPEVTTTYMLAATVGGSMVTATTTVAVTAQHGVNTVTLTADEEMSGYIRSSGVERTVGIYVGDDNADRGFQGFLTFDISGIPDDAIISRVIVNLSDYDTPYDLPYPELGCLRAYVHEYDRLDGQYATKTPRNPIGEWCDFDELETRMGFSGFREALQEAVGEGRFQFRLQFSDGESDFDGVRDLLHWQRGNLPTLTVEYRLD